MFQVGNNIIYHEWLILIWSHHKLYNMLNIVRFYLLIRKSCADFQLKSKGCLHINNLTLMQAPRCHKGVATTKHKQSVFNLTNWNLIRYRLNRLWNARHPSGWNTLTDIWHARIFACQEDQNFRTWFLVRESLIFLYSTVSLALLTPG